MEIQQPQPKQWYDNKVLLIILFFLFPPMGIYGILKHKTDTWKKVLYILPFASVVLLFIFAIIFSIAHEMNRNYYQEGLDFAKDGDFKTALNRLKEVKKSDENYNSAILKINEIESNIKLAEIEKEKQIELNIQRLKKVQKAWADSIVESESKPGNRHFVGNKLSLPDTILFEYTEGVTKNGFSENLKVDTIAYRGFYNDEVTKKLGKEFLNHKVHISFIPNKSVDFEKVTADNNRKAERRNKIMRQFSQWDGSHSKVEKYVKSSMNNPNSFDHVRTTYSDKGSYILVNMTFRGKNAFGAKVISSVTAKVDEDGNILSIQ